MTYLIETYPLPLLLTALGGMWWGWKSRAADEGRRFGGLFPFVIVALIIGALAAGMKWVPGRPGLWLDTVVLFVGVYLAGCIIGATQLARWFGVPDIAPAVAAATGAATAVAEVAKVAKEAVAPVASLVETATSAVTIPEPVQTAVDTITEAMSNAAETSAESTPEPAQKPAATKPEPVKASTGPAAAAEAMALGSRPAGLAAPRAGGVDPLTLIRGIGPQNEIRLHALGIYHFDQIAAWTAKESQWVGGYLAFPGRIERESWVDQAKAIVAGTSAGTPDRVRRDRSEGGDDAAHYEGVAPAGLDAPRDGQGDDLTLIKGVGPVIATRLNELGLWHFDQIGRLSDQELRYISSAAGFPGRAINENWAGECRILAAGGDTEHSRALKAARKRGAA
ncbi:MAG: hypothetical protein WCH83_03735 [Alphaproteobacteria bacterium]